jgi:hypothetical protein
VADNITTTQMETSIVKVRKDIGSDNQQPSPFRNGRGSEIKIQLVEAMFKTCYNR